MQKRTVMHFKGMPAGGDDSFKLGSHLMGNSVLTWVNCIQINANVKTEANNRPVGERHEICNAFDTNVQNFV